MEKKKILIIDDEVGFTNLVRLNLEDTGNYEVREENEGARGLQVAKSFRPDLIFLDIVMPDMQGTDVARLIKEDAALKNVPIVFLTAIVSAEETDSHGGMIGGNPFLAKPVSSEKLIETIEKIVP
ncbi:MAG: response regulator [Deltaproteobacteria bacterium]|nr:response regulator [Deltaproteobacteria bacterium]